MSSAALPWVLAKTADDDSGDGDKEFHRSGALVGFTDATAKGIGAAVDDHPSATHVRHGAFPAEAAGAVHGSLNQLTATCALVSGKNESVHDAASSIPPFLRLSLGLGLVHARLACVPAFGLCDLV